MAGLTRQEAQARAALIRVTAYRVHLDLDSGDRTFESTARVRFTCAEPGASTFLDLSADTVHAVTLNGADLDPAQVTDGRLVLPGLRPENEVVVRATIAYCNDGQGLHRAVDPSDGRHYVYGHLFLDAAPRVFACFDQPDLKAPYDVTVQAPEEWIVVGNGDARRTGHRQWELTTTVPLATYFVTVCAGPYVSVTDTHDGIGLGLHARASLAGPLRAQAPQMLEVTKQAFDHYHRLFGIRYPFGEYHQVFVPEFNAGAMENPGCVTLRDQYVFRGAVTRDDVLTRSVTIAHELAHMWFGDLVTMAWWDDLWLNESFAEYMGNRALVDATEFTEAWVDFTMARKIWGYAAERMPSNHPVAGSPAPDTRTALHNFDGISYAKGSAALRQLIAFIGDDAFTAGVAAYLDAHRFGNASLADFLACMELASGAELGTWTQAWLGTAGLDTLRVDLEADPDDPDRIGRAVLHRTPPAQHPADRPHHLDVAGFSAGARVFAADLTVQAGVTEVRELAGAPMATVVVPNASDLTWAHVQLSPATVSALPDELARIAEPEVRAVVWTALVDGIALTEIDPRRFIDVFAAAWPAEDSPAVLTRMGTHALQRIVPEYLDLPHQQQARATVADAASRLLEGSDPGSTRALAAARVLAASSPDEALLRTWMDGTDLPTGLRGDSDFRWLTVRTLAARGLVDAADIDAVLEQDRTMQGNLAALAARAARPDAASKAWAWEQLVGRHGRSNHELNALASGFWQARDLDVVRPYVPRYFSEIPALAGRVGEDALARVAQLAFPRTVVEAATDEAATAALARADLSPAVRRSMVDTQSVLAEALASRRTFGQAQSSEAKSSRSSATAMTDQGRPSVSVNS